MVIESFEESPQQEAVDPDAERHFTPQASGDDELRHEKSLRPRCFEEFIGQGRVVENLRIAIDAARARGDVLDHVLFSGMPGLGKTTLSNLISGALDVELHVTSGPALDKGRDIVGTLTRIARGDILFIDEIHRMSRESEEYLYSAMEDFQVDIMLDKGVDARSVRIQIETFTLVGATTREGQLSDPFRSRFGISEKLELYPPKDLREIVLRSAARLGCSIDGDAAQILGERCRGTPRYANRFLRRVRDVAQHRRGWTENDGALALGVDDVDDGLGRLGVDEHGLDRVDRRLLEVLLDNEGPVGLKTLAVSVGEEERTIEDVYEPYLIQRGLITKTARGRRPTGRARTIYGGAGRSFVQRDLGLS